MLSFITDMTWVWSCCFIFIVTSNLFTVTSSGECEVLDTCQFKAVNDAAAVHTHLESVQLDKTSCQEKCCQTDLCTLAVYYRGREAGVSNCRLHLCDPVSGCHSEVEVGDDSVVMCIKHLHHRSRREDQAEQSSGQTSNPEKIQTSPNIQTTDAQPPSDKQTTTPVREMTQTQMGAQTMTPSQNAETTVAISETKTPSYSTDNQNLGQGTTASASAQPPVSAPAGTAAENNKPTSTVETPSPVVTETRPDNVTADTAPLILEDSDVSANTTVGSSDNTVPQTKSVPETTTPASVSQTDSVPETTTPASVSQTKSVPETTTPAPNKTTTSTAATSVIVTSTLTGAPASNSNTMQTSNVTSKPASEGQMVSSSLSPSSESDKPVNNTDLSSSDNVTTSAVNATTPPGSVTSGNTNNSGNSTMTSAPDSNNITDSNPTTVSTAHNTVTTPNISNTVLSTFSDTTSSRNTGTVSPDTSLSGYKTTGQTSTLSSNVTTDVSESKSPDSAEAIEAAELLAEMLLQDIESTDNTTSSNGSLSQSADTGTNLGSDSTMIVVLVSALSIGVTVFLVVVMLVGRRVLESWKRRHYSRIDYLP